MRGSRKIVREGPTLITVFFLVDVGRKEPNTIISRPSSARQRNTINVDDGPTFNAGLVALHFSGDPDQYCQENLYFYDFQGRGQTPCAPPHLLICACSHCLTYFVNSCKSWLVIPAMSAIDTAS